MSLCTAWPFCNSEGSWRSHASSCYRLSELGCCPSSLAHRPEWACTTPDGSSSGARRGPSTGSGKSFTSPVGLTIHLPNNGNRQTHSTPPTQNRRQKFLNNNRTAEEINKPQQKTITTNVGATVIGLKPKRPPNQPSRAKTKPEIQTNTHTHIPTRTPLPPSGHAHTKHTKHVQTKTTEHKQDHHSTAGFTHNGTITARDDGRNRQSSQSRHGPWGLRMPESTITTQATPAARLAYASTRGAQNKEHS